MTVQFAEFTMAEAVAVRLIIDRADKLAKKTGGEIDRLSLEMDLSAVHARNPLRLEELAEADDFNFAHDIYGIMRRLDRSTGELVNNFEPRFSQRKEAEPC